MTGERPLMVGEQPGHGDPGQPLGGRIAVRLCDLMGWPQEHYTGGTAYTVLTTYFETWNLIDRDTGTEPWDRRAASRSWQQFLERRLASRNLPGVVVVFGRRAAEAVGARDRPYYEWLDGQLYDSVILPHPSGLNRLWNDPVTGARVREHLAIALGKAGIGRPHDGRLG
jgi:hypothetical protein